MTTSDSAVSPAPDRLDIPFGDPLVRTLFPPLPKGVHWGLERMERALTALGDPHRAYATIHVGGTNGKGSVTSTVASVLLRAGHAAGCYTSPHLCSFRERMLVDGRPLRVAALEAYAADVREPIVRYRLTFFEAVTLLAMHAFREEGVEIAAMEVGLGGRLDATNVLRPEVTAVTNVAMDHADFLGNTLRQIAREKAGIMKEGVPFVTAERDPEVRELFSVLAAERGAPMVSVESPTDAEVQVEDDHTSLTLNTARWGELDVRTPLVGYHQATNAGLAVTVLEQLGDPWRPTAEQVVEGIRSVVYHGRDEVQRIDGRTWLFDVAHNTAGILSLVDTIDRLDLPRPLVALVGVLGDKDWQRMLPPLLSRTDAAFLTEPPSAPAERRWDPQEAADRVDTLTVVRVVEDFPRALRRASERAGKGTVVVTGSVHTVGSAMRLLGIDPLGEASGEPGDGGRG
ncbi:MAG: folylpolyglutamate synthase/dihydrofolate synthase family protein [Longimicrobiales bacterium]|nr:folylpolyglutamate synthase/dihydrofolate synthase family protein [Longimicrobiales bacterium]